VGCSGRHSQPGRPPSPACILDQTCGRVKAGPRRRWAAPQGEAVGISCQPLCGNALPSAPLSMGFYLASGGTRIHLGNHLPAAGQRLPGAHGRPRHRHRGAHLVQIVAVHEQASASMIVSRSPDYSCSSLNCPSPCTSSACAWRRSVEPPPFYFWEGDSQPQLPQEVALIPEPRTSSTENECSILSIVSSTSRVHMELPRMRRPLAVIVPLAPGHGIELGTNRLSRVRSTIAVSAWHLGTQARIPVTASLHPDNKG